MNKHSVSITADGANFHIHKIFHQKIKRHCRAINICRNTSDSGRSLISVTLCVISDVMYAHVIWKVTRHLEQRRFCLLLAWTDWLFVLRVTDKILALKCVVIFQNFSTLHQIESLWRAKEWINWSVFLWQNVIHRPFKSS